MSFKVSFTVYGDPMPKGSKTRLKSGVMIDAAPARSKDPEKRRLQRKRMTDWPLAVQVSSSAAAGGITAPIRAAVNVCATFYMPRPASRKRDVFHTTKPDLDKLLRNVSDAMKKGGLLHDDCYVVSFNGSQKRYTAIGDPPRCEITVTQVLDGD